MKYVRVIADPAAASPEEMEALHEALRYLWSQPSPRFTGPTGAPLTRFNTEASDKEWGVATGNVVVACRKGFGLSDEERVDDDPASAINQVLTLASLIGR